MIGFLLIMDGYKDWEREGDVTVFKLLHEMSEKVMYVNDDKMVVLKDEGEWR